MISIFTSLMPVVLLIALGYFIAKLGVVSQIGSQDLTRLTFNVLAPALLFHTMSEVHLHELNVQPVLLYFFVALSLFCTAILLLGFSRRSTVLGLASTYSNTTMIGVPIVGLVYGAPGLVYLFTLISVHGIILLTTATIVLEFSLIKENNAENESEVTESLNPWVTIGKSLRNAIFHPVPLPIIAGIIFANYDWQLPKFIEQPVIWAGQAFSPLALMLVGISLFSATGSYKIGVVARTESSGLSNGFKQPTEVIASQSSLTTSNWRVACTLTLIKNIINPVLVLLIGKELGIQGLALSVMVLAAGMPIGANVFLFSQRYQVSQTEVTIAVSLSTLAAMLTVPLVMWVAGLIN